MPKYYFADWGFWNSDYLETITTLETINTGLKSARAIKILTVDDKSRELKEFNRENKMKEKAEMPSNSTIRAVARKCPQVEEVLKGLFKEAFEEEKKEIELENGQIYKCCVRGDYYGEFYLLTQHLTTYSDVWKLMSLNHLGEYWGDWVDTPTIKGKIERNFTLCPHATIMVKENDC